MGRKAKPDVAMDTSGTYVRSLGYKGTAPDFKPVRFYLGKDKTQAQIRSPRLELVWQDVEKRWQRDHETPRPVWDDLTLQIGQGVARGDEVIRIDFDCWSDPEGMVILRDALQRDFPSVRLALTDADEERKGEEARRQKATRLMEDARYLMARNTSQTLYQALDAFGVFLDEKYGDHSGKVNANQNKGAKELKILKEHVKDTPLGFVDLEFLERWVGHWAKRPMTKRGKPCAPKTVMNFVKRIREFIKWLHKSKSFDWRKPEDYEVSPVRIKETQEERAKKASGDQVSTYTDEELALLWKHAKPLDRVLMLLALNCGFGTAEIGSLQMSEVHLSKNHRKYKTPGNWLMRIRGKTGVYGEWKLWDRTAEAIKWYLSIRPTSEEGCLLVTKKGEPVVKTTIAGNRNQFIPSAWLRLTERIQKLEGGEFRKLSFNKLRKTATNAIRELSSGEVAGIFACHGQPVKSDTLLDLYSNKDFRKVHLACDQWGERLEPMLDSVKEPFEKKKRKHKTTDEGETMRARVLALRAENKTMAQIAAIVGRSVRAVHYHIHYGDEK